MNILNKNRRLFITASIVMAGFASAKEIHVSKAGNDKNDGSANKPLLTIQAAANVAMPGDVITVGNGTYREEITPPRGGDSESKPIVYQAAKGEKVAIKGSEVITGWKKLENDTWQVRIPNQFFGKFNPYNDLIRGDWFDAKNRKHHTGAVYLNGHWLMEAAEKELVSGTTDEKDPLWWAEVDSNETTIWAQFKGKNPNTETVEINVRQTVFYPDRPFINYITVRGFSLQHAATNWAPPTAEQMGLIGTHWSRGWVIENNTVQYSKCVGISLGKYGDQFDNTSAEAAEGYVGTINRALAFGWNKSTIGSHIVRNNTIAFCEQAGIVGSMGCAFSTVEGNIIHDIHVRRLFAGFEMAGIKFHGGIDVIIRNNRIYNTCLAIWLDWMAQGVHVSCNLLHENDLDIFLEMNHGPTLLSNNILLSKINLLMDSKGAAFVHNLFSGRFDVVVYDSRVTPYLKPHSTFVEKLAGNEGGDIQFINNLFVNNANASEYGKAFLPVLFDGNVYTKGTVRAVAGNMQQRFGEFNDEGKKEFAKLKAVDAEEKNMIEKSDFDAGAKLINENMNAFLEIHLDTNWLSQAKRGLATTESLGNVVVPGLPFENPDGTDITIDKDYSGKNRNAANPSPGPFEIEKTGIVRIRVW